MTRGRLLRGAAAASMLVGAVGAVWPSGTLASESLRSAPIKNTGFAGYRRNSGSSTATFNVRATFVVPRIASCGPTARAIAPDIDVSNGSSGSAVGLFVGCYKGKPDYFPFIQLNGVNTDYAPGTVQPGDHIELRLSEGPNAAELTFQDLTHNLVKVKTGSGRSNLSFPGIGDDYWVIGKSELGVPSFGRIVFSHCTVNGAALGAGGSPGSPAVLEYDRTRAGVLQIATGPLSANKEAFTTYFKHS